MKSSGTHECKLIKELNCKKVGETLRVVGGLGRDREPMRLIANPNIQRLKAVLEDTQAMGGVKIPCLTLKCLPGCEYLPFSICNRWHPPAKSW